MQPLLFLAVYIINNITKEMKNKPIIMYKNIHRVVDTLYVFSENNQVYKCSNQQEWIPINFNWESIID